MSLRTGVVLHPRLHTIAAPLRSFPSVHDERSTVTSPISHPEERLFAGGAQRFRVSSRGTDPQNPEHATRKQETCLTAP